MSDNVQTITVVLEAGTSGERAEALVAAIESLRGVVRATPTPETFADYACREQVAFAMERQLYAAIRSIIRGETLVVAPPPAGRLTR